MSILFVPNGLGCPGPSFYPWLRPSYDHKLNNKLNNAAITVPYTWLDSSHTKWMDECLVPGYSNRFYLVNVYGCLEGCLVLQIQLGDRSTLPVSIRRSSTH